MSSRTKKIIGAVVALIVLLLLLLLLWLSSLQPDEVVQPPEQEQPPTPIGSLQPSEISPPPVFEATEPPAPEQEEEPVADPRSNLSRVAAAFAERYGSYSNQGDYENLEELQSLMTADLADDTQAFIDQARSNGAGGAGYAGYTTRAINTRVTVFDEESGRATVVVNTQREEVTTQGSRVYYQELELNFVLVNETWKVESAAWAEQGG